MHWFAFCLPLALALPAAAADQPREPSPAQRAQQERMRDCSKQAAGQNMHGEPRKAFMKTCMSGRPQ